MDIEDVDALEAKMTKNYLRREKFLKALVDDVEEDDIKTLTKNARVANELMTAQETSLLTQKKLGTDEKIANALSGGVAELLTGGLLSMLTVQSSEDDIKDKLATIDVDAIETSPHAIGEDTLDAEPLDPKTILEEI